MKKVMKSGWKRLCAVILAAAMTLTMLPVDVRAEDEKKEFYRNLARLAFPIALQSLMLASVAAGAASKSSER